MPLAPTRPTSTTPLPATTSHDRAAQAHDDRRLLALAGGGDEAAFEVLVARHASSCLAHAVAVLRDPHFAQDAVQEALLDLWRLADSYDPTRCSVQGWVHTLTHRRAVDRARNQQRRPALALEHAGDPADIAHDVAAEAVTAALGGTAVAALATLPEGQRRAIVLAYWGGYTMAEVAVLEGIPIGTVKTRCRAALARLRVLLGEGINPSPVGFGQTAQA